MGRICLLGFFLALCMSCCMKNKHYTVFYQLYCLVLKIFQLTVLKCSINTYLISLPREYHAHFAGTVCSAKLQLWVDNNTENEPPVSFLALEKKIQIFTEKCSITVTNRFRFNVWTFMRLCFLSLTLRKPLFSFYLLFFFFCQNFSFMLNCKVILISGGVLFWFLKWNLIPAALLLPLFSASGNHKCSHLRDWEIKLGKEEFICASSATFQAVTQAGQLSIILFWSNISPKESKTPTSKHERKSITWDHRLQRQGLILLLRIFLI